MMFLFSNCPKMSNILDKRENEFLDKYCMSDKLLVKIVTVYVCSCLCFMVVFARYSIIIYYSAHSAIARQSVRLSVRPSVTRVDQSKTVEVRIMQFSPLSSPMTLVSSWLTSPRNSKGNIGSEGAK